MAAVMRVSKQGLPPIIALAAVSFLAGIVLAGAVVAHRADVVAAQAASTLALSRSRIAMLESALRRQAENSLPVNLARPAADPGPAAAAAPPAPAPVVAAAKPVHREPAEPRPAAPRPIPAATTSTTAAARAPAGSSAATTPAKPVTAEQLAAAKASNKIEGVDGEKLGVTKVESTGVTMKNGMRIPVGGMFPSKERLLGVDPATGQIITDARTLIVF